MKGKEDRYIRADARHENIQTVVVSRISKERGGNDSARQLRGYKSHLIKIKMKRNCRQKLKRRQREKRSTRPRRAT